MAHDPDLDATDVLEASLRRTAVVAEEVAAEQRQTARLARQAASRHRRNRDADVTADLHAVSGLVAGSVGLLNTALGTLRRAWAHDLAGRGMSLRAIAARFGVSHQRVAALLHDRTRSDRVG